MSSLIIISVLQVNQTSTGSFTHRWKSSHELTETEALSTFLHHDNLLHLFHKNHCVLAQGRAFKIFYLVLQFV
jgi:hypothetical protein